MFHVLVSKNISYFNIRYLILFFDKINQMCEKKTYFSAPVHNILYWIQCKYQVNYFVLIKSSDFKVYASSSKLGSSRFTHFEFLPYLRRKLNQINQSLYHYGQTILSKRHKTMSTKQLSDKSCKSQRFKNCQNRF